MSYHVSNQENGEPAGDLTLREYVRVLKRRKWYVIYIVVAAVIVSLALSLATTKMYRASAEVLVESSLNSNTLGNTDLVVGDRVLQNELARAGGSEMKSLVREQIGSEPSLSVAPANSKNADVLVFSAESSSKQRAAEAANKYAETYIGSRRQVLTTSLDGQADTVRERLRLAQEGFDSYDGRKTAEALQFQQLIDDYKAQLETIETSRALVESSAGSIIDSAQVPSQPFKPQPLRSGLLFAFFGLLLGVGAALGSEYFDQSIHDEADLARASGLQVMAVVPRAPADSDNGAGLVSLDRQASPQAEAYRVLRTALQFRGLDSALKVVQVTSAKPSEGKTTTAANLAVVSARAGNRTLLIDADLRRPRVHKLFNVSNRAGLIDVLRGGSLNANIFRSKQVDTLSVLPSGPPPGDPAEVLAGRGLSKLILELREEYEFIVVDTPPVLAVADPLIVANDADGLIFVASAQGTSRDEVSSAVGHLEDVGAPLVGTVLNNFEPASGSRYEYRYTYGQYETSGATR